MTASPQHPRRPAAADASSPVRPMIGYVAPARWSRHFTQGPASVTLRTNWPALLSSAEDTLYAYTLSKIAASRWTITLHTNVPIDVGAAETHFADSATLDIGPNQQARSIPAPRGRAFWIHDQATLLQLDSLAGTVTVYCGNRDAATVFAGRLVRQAMTAQLLEHGAVYAHAAALVHAGRGVLIAGPKGAGKTTTLLSTLRLADGDFVANDRLLLRRDNDGIGPVGYAWPTPLRATVSTLRAVPDMSRFLPSDRHNAPAGQSAPAGKIEIEPDELRSVLPGVRILGEVRPALMLWPYRSASDIEPELVPAAEVRDVLQRTQFFMYDPATKTTSHRNHWLLPTDEGRTAVSLTAVTDLLARTAPCFRIPVTDSPAALAARITALIDQLPAATIASRPPR